MVSANGVKVLDFGLAGPIDPETESGNRITVLSREGAAGTLPYMAPELLEGQPGDLRSDIFSYGAVLFEMFSGRRPFTGATEAALIASILRCEAPPLPATGPGAQALRRVIRRCLVKDPGNAGSASTKWWICSPRCAHRAELSRAQTATTEPASAPFVELSCCRSRTARRTLLRITLRKA
jgi:serine/threonine protein kinase